MKVLITSITNGVQQTVDYTRYVLDGSISIEDSLNVPTICSLQFANIDNAFVVPKRGSYVEIVSELCYPSAPAPDGYIAYANSTSSGQGNVINIMQENSMNIVDGYGGAFTYNSGSAQSGLNDPAITSDNLLNVYALNIVDGSTTTLTVCSITGGSSNTCGSGCECGSCTPAVNTYNVVNSYNVASTIGVNTSSPNPANPCIGFNPLDGSIILGLSPNSSLSGLVLAKWSPVTNSIIATLTLPSGTAVDQTALKHIQSDGRCVIRGTDSFITVDTTKMQVMSTLNNVSSLLSQYGNNIPSGTTGNTAYDSTNDSVVFGINTTINGVKGVTAKLWRVYLNANGNKGLLREITGIVNAWSESIRVIQGNVYAISSGTGQVVKIAYVFNSGVIPANGGDTVTQVSQSFTNFNVAEGPWVTYPTSHIETDGSGNIYIGLSISPSKNQYSYGIAIKLDENLNYISYGGDGGGCQAGESNHIAANCFNCIAVVPPCFGNPGDMVYVRPLTQNNSYSNCGLVLFTGFITNEMERVYQGLSNKVGGKTYNGQVYQYNCNCTSDEWLLNCQAIPYIPAFVNQTDSAILAGIANALLPDFFDTTSLMASGTLIPYYQYDPTQTWSDVAKTFGDANRYHYKVINKQILYQPFGDAPLGIAYDDQNQTEGYLAPYNLQTGVVSVPPVNDCTVIGDVEPQTNWDNYYVGDGFSSNFQMTHQVWQGVSDTLLQDDWTEGQFTQGTWNENNPQNTITLVDGNGNTLGALNVVQNGNNGVYTPIQNATYIQAQNGLELAGGLNLQHGSFTFNDTASGGGGLIGALFGSSTFTPGNALCAFGVSGQNNLGTYTVVSVQILQGNTNQVNLTVNGTAPTSLQPGNVLACSSFVGASFLNNKTLFIVSIAQGTGSYVITAQGSQVYSSPYGPTSDSGSINFASNAVLVTASGAAGIVIQPILNGQYVGQAVVTQPNHQYLLQTWIGAQAPTRYTRSYSNLTNTATYGAQNLAASGSISFVITDVNLGNYVIEEQNPLFGLFPSAPPPVVTKYTATGQTLPPFALYCLINGIDLNISCNYTLLSEPPQGYLTVQSLTGASGGNLPWLPSQLSVPIVYQLGFGQENQTAQISQQGEAYALAFYTDDIPSVGARIRFQSWSAGQSVARVQDTVAIANEAAISGDSGIRSAIMNNLTPLPRTSDECEAAAAACILDREYPQFQGTYSVQTIPYKFENLLAPSVNGYPMTGRFLYVNSPVRAITGQYLATNTVRFQVLELKQEVLSVSVDFGPDTYLEKLLPAFLERDQNVLTPTQTVAPPNPITLPQVLNAYLPTLNNAVVTGIVNSLTGNYISVNLGAPPVTGCEVRNVDGGWGIADQGRVGLFTSQTFTLPRTARDQTWYLRTLNNGIYSRFSKALRVVYPLVPSAPTLVSYDSDTIVFDYAGDVRDIYGLEVRAPGVTGIAAVGGGDAISCFSRVALPNTNEVGNAFAVYNPPSGQKAFTPAVGDIVYLTNTLTPTNASYSGLKLITGVGTNTPSLNVDVAAHASGTNGGFSNPYNVYPGSGISTGQSLGGTITETWYQFGVGNGKTPQVLYVNATWSITLQGKGAAGVILQYSLNQGGNWSNIVAAYTNGNGGSNTPYYVNLPPGQDLTQVQVRGTVFGSGLSGVGVGEATLQISNMYISQGGSRPITGLVPYSYMSWYDYGGNLGTPFGSPGSTGSATCGEAQIANAVATTVTAASGSLTGGGLATLYTGSAHGLSVGNTAIISCGYVTWPSGYGTQPTDGAIFCGVAVVTAVPNSTTFQYQIPNNNIYTSGLPIVALTGLVGQVPITSTGAGGVIVQQPVFSPSDLVIDLTQPNFAAIVELLAATQPGGRVTGLVGYFFNLTWDYSAGTVIPSFTAPALSGIIIDSATQQVQWQNIQGNPSGYRVEITDLSTGLIRNKFTVNHPYNPQVLTEFQLSNADFAANCSIKITPFDAIGDGIPSFIQWAGSGSGGGGGTGGSGVQLITADLPIVASQPIQGVFDISSNVFTGDTGSGGAQGDVPAPPAGSAAGQEFLSASGTFAPVTIPSAPVVFACTWGGLLTPSIVILHVPIGSGLSAIQFAASLAGSAGHLLTAPTSQVAIPILKNGTQVGAMIFASTNNYATFTGSAFTLNPPTDYLEAVLPSTQDATASDLGFMLIGRRTFP